MKSIKEIETIKEVIIRNNDLYELLKNKGISEDNILDLCNLAMSALDVDYCVNFAKSHYNEPVMPLSKFCNAIITWANIISENCRNNQETHSNGIKRIQQGDAYHNYLFKIIIDIQKSNLLYRILFLEEEPRKNKCPIHNGHWSGIEWNDSKCQYGCNLTGWIK